MKGNRSKSVALCAVLALHLGIVLTNVTSTKKVEVRRQPIIVRTRVQTDPIVQSSTVSNFSPKRDAKKKKSISSSIKNSSLKRKKIASPPSPPPFSLPIASCKALPFHLPRSIETLHIDAPLREKKWGSYQCLMVQTLKGKLQLPEEGAVQIAVTVLKSGYVEKIQILYAESAKNRHYLERVLTSLCLPPFSDELYEKERHTFTLTFRHEK